MATATKTGLMAMCGGRYAVVPADVFTDKSLSRNARWLFGVLCGHADGKGHLWRSLKRIAKQEDVTVRVVQLWMGELEKAGLVVKLNEAGKKCEFQVIRRPNERPRARAQNVCKIVKRRLQFGDYGRKGAAERARQRAAAGAEPVNSISPPPEQHFTGTGVNVVSPKQDSLKTRKERTELKQAAGVYAMNESTTAVTGQAEQSPDGPASPAEINRIMRGEETADKPASAAEISRIMRGAETADTSTTTEANGTDGASGQKVCLQGVEGGKAQAERQHLESRNGAEKEQAVKADDFAKLRRKIAQATPRYPTVPSVTAA